LFFVFLIQCSLEGKREHPRLELPLSSDKNQISMFFEDGTKALESFYGFNLYEKASRSDYDEYTWDMSFARKGEELQNLIGDFQADTIIEVGSFLGGSTVGLANHLSPKGLLYAVDTFLGSPEHIPLSEYMVTKELYKAHPKDYDILFLQFIKNIAAKGLESKVVPIRNTSANAALYFNRFKIQADLIYIDAAHEKIPVLEDMCLYYNHLKVGGLFLGDDMAGTGFPGVAEAVELFSKKYDVPYEVIQYKWLIKKEKDIKTSFDDFIAN
jgi:predicted O-methyltransferase YrrM